MDQSRQGLRDDFIRNLSVYSQCIMPYLRNVQEKYALAYYAPETEQVDIKAYCKQEYLQVMNAKKALDSSRQ